MTANFTNCMIHNLLLREWVLLITSYLLWSLIWNCDFYYTNKPMTGRTYLPLESRGVIVIMRDIILNSSPTRSMQQWKGGLSVPRLSSQSSWNGWGSKRQVVWPLRGENRGLMGLVSHRVSLRYSLWLRGWPKAAEDRVIKELWKPVDQWLMRKAPVGFVNAILWLASSWHMQNQIYPSMTSRTGVAKAWNPVQQFKWFFL